MKTRDEGRWNCNRFKILHCQFSLDGKYENRIDLVFLLNEMLRKFITRRLAESYRYAGY